MPATPRNVKIPQRLQPLAVAAEYRSVAKSTLRLWMAEGKLTRWRVGDRLIYVDLDEIDALTVASSR